MYILARIEESWISILLRESGLAFFASLSIHGLAMALVVGVNVAISLWVLTRPQQACPMGLAKFFPLHWLGVAFIFASGLALLLAYPAKALTNPVFYFKIAALTAGLLIALRYQKFLNNETSSSVGHQKKLRPLALASLTAWFLTVSAGRFLAYTNSVLLASRFY